MSVFLLFNLLDGLHRSHGPPWECLLEVWVTTEDRGNQKTVGTSKIFFLGAGLRRKKAKKKGSVRMPLSAIDLAG